MNRCGFPQPAVSLEATADQGAAMASFRTKAPTVVSSESKRIARGEVKGIFACWCGGVLAGVMKMITACTCRERNLDARRKHNVVFLGSRSNCPVISTCFSSPTSTNQQGGWWGTASAPVITTSNRHVAGCYGMPISDEWSGRDSPYDTTSLNRPQDISPT